MTVKHLQQIQRQQLATAVATDPGVIMRFKSGFDECAAEVSRYISRLEGVDSEVKQRLTAHLHRCVSSLQQISAFPHHNMFSALTQNCDKNTIVLPNVPSVPGDVNNNSNQNGERIQIPSGLHLIPSRLPTGELALLVPNSNHISTFLNAPTGATFQFPSNTSLSMNSVLSPTLGGTLTPNGNHASAFTAVSKNQEYPSPTSTADFVKKESNLSEKEDFKTPSYLKRATEPLYYQNYNFKVTETRDGGDPTTEDQDFKNSKLLPSGHDLTEGAQSYGKLNAFGHKFSESVDYEQKVTQRASSSSFQKNVADSTTSFTPLKEEEVPEAGFKPFQVEIPNSHLKAHISISRNSDDVKASSLQIHHKPNPNFTINPNKLYQKSPHKFVRNYSNVENSFSESSNCEMGFDKYRKIEPLTIATKTDEIGDLSNYPGMGCNQSTTKSSTSSQSNEATATSQVIEIPYSRNAKRPLSNGSPEVPSPSSSEQSNKIPRISLNVTLTDDQQSKIDQNVGNRCKRISVIVEDSSKSNVRDNNKEVSMNGSSQKDMWRPW